jgi:hypothetical protein
LDRLVDAGVGGKAERFGAPSLQHADSDEVAR